MAMTTLVAAVTTLAVVTSNLASRSIQCLSFVNKTLRDGPGIDWRVYQGFFIYALLDPISMRKY